MATDPLKLLGMARRARKLVLGLTAVKITLQRRKAKAVIVAEDVSVHTRTRVIRQAEVSGVPVLLFSSKHELGRALGREEVGVLAITDGQFAEAVRRAISEAGQPE